MEIQHVIIRTADESDAAELLEIYGPYVTDTAISFEYEVPSEAEFRQRIRNISAHYPYLVAVYGGKIVGYAYAAAFKERKAYDWSVETTIYIRQGEHGKGIGRRLYATLEKFLAAQGILNMNACIAYVEEPDEHLTQDSPRFHEKMGFKTIGRFHQSGFKFGRWYDMIWMEKMIGEHTSQPQEFVPFAELMMRR